MVKHDAEWSADRAILALAKRIEGKDEDEPVKLTVKELRSLLIKVVVTGQKAGSAEETAESARRWAILFS